jgi:outer membrane murein-binding lipoprotein Lpp
MNTQQNDVMRQFFVLISVILLVVLISGCVNQNKAETTVAANQDKIKADLQASGLDMNTNKLSTTYVNETFWKVKVYEEYQCQTGQPCPETYCIVYASIDKNTGAINNLEFAFGCSSIYVAGERIDTSNKCTNFNCVGGCSGSFGAGTMTRMDVINLVKSSNVTIDAYKNCSVSLNDIKTTENILYDSCTKTWEQWGLASGTAQNRITVKISDASKEIISTECSKG